MEARNKLTLLIDGNWLLMSRMSVLVKKFDKANPAWAKEEASVEFKELLAKSINIILWQFKCIDNIIFIADGGSWRKKLAIPDTLKETTYKGNRSKAVEIDWDYIYKPFNELFEHCKSLGITCSRYTDCEGDDLVWYWSRRLNSEGVNCMIWSSDNDLKQLVQYDADHNTFTAWYNNKNGLFLSNDLDQRSTDPLDFFLTPQICIGSLEELKQICYGTIEYIDPDMIAIDKIFRGDSGDNIKSVVLYKKGNKVYKLSQRQYDDIIDKFNITSARDIGAKVDSISQYIPTIKSLTQYHLSPHDIHDMLEYNIKLVWLNESAIPDAIIATMNQGEYKSFPVDDIRSNYTILLGENSYIKDIFETL